MNRHTQLHVTFRPCRDAISEFQKSAIDCGKCTLTNRVPFYSRQANTSKNLIKMNITSGIH